MYFGESLGTAVAVDLAVEHPPAALVLRSPFTSMADVGQHHYPFLPVRFLLRDRFAAIDQIQRIRAPLLHDRLMMETAGAQCLLLAGVFEDQKRRRHNIRWYAALGASFFSRAALQERSLHKARLLDAIATRFELWRRRHAQLSRELCGQPYLLTPPRPPTLR